MMIKVHPRDTYELSILKKKKITIQFVCMKEGLHFKGTSNSPELIVLGDSTVVCNNMLAAN